MTRALFVTAVILLAVASFVFAKNQHNRYIIEVLLGAPAAANTAKIFVPEREFSYTANDLNAFKSFLSSKPGPFSGTALDFYVRPTLIWNDLIFAIALGGFVIASWLWIIAAFDVAGMLRWLFIVFAAMGFLYTVSDVAEDTYLARILSKNEAVTPDEARLAETLTRTKFVTIVSSIQGGAVFQILSWIFPQRP